MTAPEPRVVAAWHEALNSGDADRLVELSNSEIEAVGPCDTGRGARLLREWVERAGIRLNPLRTFHGVKTVVVEQEARWRSPETGELSGSQVVASLFVVCDGKVASVSRHSDLRGALRRWSRRITDLGHGRERWRGGRGVLMVASMEIRRYRADDREAVWRSHNEALDGAGAHLGNGPWDADLGEIGVDYLESGGEFLVGVVDGRVVAMGALRPVSPGEAEVKRVRFGPAFRGRGYGRALLDALHRRAAGLGLSTLRLDTTVQQRAALRLYEANGYRESGRGRVGPFDCAFYERRVVV